MKMEEWKECKLGEIAHFTTGKLNSNAAEDNGLYPFFTCSPETYRINSYAFDTNAILLAGNNAEGNFNIKRYSGKFNAYQRTYVITVDDNTDLNFLFYALKLCLADFKHISQGTATKFLTAQILNNFVIRLPPLPTQQKIAAILSSLDDKIELNNKINTNLEQQAQALFKNWFVDFEPFGGKMPEGWKVGKLSDIAEITSGKRPPMKQSDFSKDVSIPLVGAASVMGYTNQVLYNEPILITGRVGTHGVIQRFSTECWPSDNTLVVKSQYYEYVYQIMCNIDYDNMNRGSTQPLITQSDLGKVECIIPDEEILNKFEQLASILFSKFHENQQENQKLANIRDTLLPKLMNGEIEVNEVRI